MKLNLADFWALFSIPEPVEEFKFLPDRRFRFDYAWPKFRIAVEVEGGIWIPGGGGHNRPLHFLKDLTKYNLAALHGWTVFRFTPKEFKDGTAGELLEVYWKKILPTSGGPVIPVEI